MKFVEIIKEKQADLYGKRQPTVAFLGDSVTHGCFNLFAQNNEVQTYMELDKAYHEKFRKIINTIYPTVPITVINAGISGDKASGGIKRLKRDVLSYNPDLVVVCYGLNDSQDLEKGIEAYRESLTAIFDEIRKSGAEPIFMTPNLMTDKLDVKFTEEVLNKCVLGIIEREKDSWLAKYVDTAREVCKNNNVTLCDCNKIWNMLKENNADINNLLANRANHPTEEMHWIFAYELVRTIFTN